MGEYAPEVNAHTLIQFSETVYVESQLVPLVKNCWNPFLEWALKVVALSVS